MIRLVPLLTALLFLAGCGGAQEQAGPDGTEEEATQAETQEVTREVTREVTLEVTQQPERMSQEEADDAKAAAVNEEITLEELRQIDTSTEYGESLVLGLGNCQLNKYAAENGQAALDEFSARYVEEVATAPEGEEVVSIQETLLMEGYSCTTQEAMSYSQGGPVE